MPCTLLPDPFPPPDRQPHFSLCFTHTRIFAHTSVRPARRARSACPCSPVSACLRLRPARSWQDAGQPLRRPRSAKAGPRPAAPERRAKGPVRTQAPPDPQRENPQGPPPPEPDTQQPEDQGPPAGGEEEGGKETARVECSPTSVANTRGGRLLESGLVASSRDSPTFVQGTPPAKTTSASARFAWEPRGGIAHAKLADTAAAACVGCRPLCTPGTLLAVRRMGSFRS
jgi:hypothetical protein